MSEAQKSSELKDHFVSFCGEKLSQMRKIMSMTEEQETFVSQVMLDCAKEGYAYCTVYVDKLMTERGVRLR